jgi:hypothetical protein
MSGVHCVDEQGGGGEIITEQDVGSPRRAPAGRSEPDPAVGRG